MAHYLLLGAGFSRNWGGWLATEVFEYLLGRPEVVDNADLRRVLWEAQSKGGFEYALESLQLGAGRGDGNAIVGLEGLQSAVIAMFDDMNRGFDSLADWEFSNQIGSQVATFLTRFDAIFSLNQDLFLERHYLSASPEMRRKDRWDGVMMPGVAPIGSGYASILGQRWQILDEEKFKLADRMQPIFKLHGSTNWNAPDGKNTLVIGGNKTGAIGGTPILKWYFDEFQKAALSGEARVMAIGYGFRDPHVNDVLVKGINERGLKIFVVSPAGASQAREVNPSNGGALFARGALDEAFERGLIGASRRSLSEIFGSNGLELAKLHRFLET